MTGEIICGDCLNVMAKMAPESVDLIVTSPPYAEQRKTQYGGIPTDKYVNWFMPLAAEMRHCLSKRGSLVIVIKEHTVNGERSEYVMDLVKAMRRQEWKWIEEYMWHKPISVPGFWPTRLKDGWEHCHHFARDMRPKMYHDQVKFRASQSALDNIKRYKNKPRTHSTTNSGFNMLYSGFNELALPQNVLTILPDFTSKLHPAPFPAEVPDFFIRLFTQAGDVVLDPFCGSGTSCRAAQKLNRKFIGIDISEEYCKIARRRADEKQQTFAEALDEAKKKEGLSCWS